MDARALGIRIAACGVVAQVAGFAVAVLQAGGGTSTHELSGAARATILVGMAVTLLGAGLAVAGPFLYGPSAGRLSPGGLAVVRLALPIVAVGVLAAGYVVIVTSGSEGTRASASPTSTGAASNQEAITDALAAQVAGPHDHGATDTTAAAAVSPGSQPQVEPSAGHPHGQAVPDQPMDRATRDQLAGQLVAARQVAMTYPTVADAVKAGYTMVTPYLPLIGAHYVNWGLMDFNFDIPHPEMLLYDGTSPTSHIVGLSYYQFSNAGEPAGFAGPNDHWHQHIGLCLRNGVVIAGENSTAAQCAALGGEKADASNGYMVHAWVVPGWDSPEGVFSPENPDLI
jgi:hypothetical protein